ncbi:D-alanine--D-alanine ligase family protein [Baekduia sp. Peel2402]|uniref:D-alanine--D-alanine ligase family protein n=1 Tax=Baekduia sp. Peel2402 TaxID=3458296 RepID=UPI00403EBBEE
MRVAVLGGGRSSEHEVSLVSAATVAQGALDAGHEVLRVTLERDGTWWHDGDELVLRPGRGFLDADVVFPVLHGPFGEDGTVQGLLELLDVPYVGSGVMASAVCMDKVVFKDLMAQAGIPQVAYALVEKDRPRPSLEHLGYPQWVKPARLGSSVGIVRVEKPEEIDAALDEAFSHDDRVIVEANSSGLEIESSVLGDTHDARVSQPGEIVLLRDGWYDYEAKYTEGGMRLEFPARISPTAIARLREEAARAFSAAGCSGLARADFFVDGETVLLNELNTLPGQTPTSVYGVLWERSGLAYPDLVDELCKIAVARFERERALRH